MTSTVTPVNPKNFSADPTIRTSDTFPPRGRPGQRGVYNGQSYEWTNQWVSANRRPGLVTPINNAAVRGYFSASDVDGDRTYNASRADGYQLTTSSGWKPQFGSSTLPAAVTSAIYGPVLAKWEQGLNFDGNFSNLKITGSSAANYLEAPHTTGNFFLCFALKLGCLASNGVILFDCTNNFTGKGILVGVSASTPRAIYVFILGTGVVLSTTVFGSQLVPLNQTSYVTVRGDGTNCYVSVNGAAESSAALSGAGMGAGLAAADIALAINVPASPTNLNQLSGVLHDALIVDGALTLAERTLFISQLRTQLGLTP